MVTAAKLLHLKPSSLLPLTIFSPKPSSPSLPKPSILSLFSSLQTQTQTQAKLHAFSYGPSLQRGKTPAKTQNQTTHQGEEEENPIDEQKFTRSFDLAALRVPASDSFALENRLRGHLLNWPRVKNIARVPGDEIDEELMTLLDKREDGGGEDDGEYESLVLTREKLVKEFNHSGFIKFKNLARISRPGKRKKKGKRGDEEVKGGNEKKQFCVVEVVGEGGEEEMRGLLGEDFKGRGKWKGSTRLLLLDERYGDKGLEELPQAIQVEN